MDTPNTPNTPNTPSTPERPELPEYIQEQIRKQQLMTREERQALIENLRAAPKGDPEPFAVRERRYIIKSALRDALRKKAE